MAAHLRLVPGGERPAGRRCPSASGSPVAGQGFRLPAVENDAGDAGGPCRPATDGTAARGLDRATGDSREYALSNQSFGQQTGANSAHLVYLEPIGDGVQVGALEWNLDYMLFGGIPATGIGSGGARVTWVS